MNSCVNFLLVLREFLRDFLREFYLRMVLPLTKIHGKNHAEIHAARARNARRNSRGIHAPKTGRTNVRALLAGPARRQGPAGRVRLARPSWAGSVQLAPWPGLVRPNWPKLASHNSSPLKNCWSKEQPFKGSITQEPMSVFP